MIDDVVNALGVLYNTPFIYEREGKLYLLTYSKPLLSLNDNGAWYSHIHKETFTHGELMDNIRKHITYSKLEKVFNLVVEGLGDHDFELCKKVDINITSEVPMTCVGTMVANAPEYINEGYMVIDRKFGNYYSIPKTAVDCCTVDDMKIIIRALDEQAVLDVRNR